MRGQHRRKDRGFRARFSGRVVVGRHGPQYTGTMARKTCRRAPRRPARKARAAPPRRPAHARNAEIAEAFRRLRAAKPEPKGELEHINPFTLLIAVVLSAQATDAGVNKATPALFAAADTPEKMAALGEEKITEYIKTIGLYRGKARNLAALSRKLIAEHGGKIPADRAALEELPGVGRKTANVVLNVAFGA